jgi:hypothetical protein
MDLIYATFDFISKNILYTTQKKIRILLEEIEDLRHGRSKRLNGHQDSDSELSISESVMVM